MFRINIPLPDGSVRFYSLNHDSPKIFPSVTTILSFGDSKEWLAVWKKQYTDEEIDDLLVYYSNRGTLFHDTLEHCTLNKITDLKIIWEMMLSETGRYTSKEILGAYQLVKKIITCPMIIQNHPTKGKFDTETLFMDYVQEVLLTEYSLHYEGSNMVIPDFYMGWAGTLDMLMVNNKNQVILVDFKTSNRPKLEEWIDKYFMQLAAYWTALEQQTEYTVQGGIVVMANDQTEEVQVFMIDKKNITEHLIKFKQKVTNFYEGVAELLTYYQAEIKDNPDWPWPDNNQFQYLLQESKKYYQETGQELDLDKLTYYIREHNEQEMEEWDDLLSLNDGENKINPQQKLLF